MSVPHARITYQDYLQLPDDQRYEVLEGELRILPTPGMLHQRILGNLFCVMRPQWHGEVLFAPLDVILSEETVVQPDPLVVLQERLSIMKPEGVRGAPDLVVEVLSPGNAHYDRGKKRRLYARYGVREYWIIDPQERTVEVTSLSGSVLETVSVVPEGGTLHSPLLPELTLAVADLFPK
ncbi:MAG TPA: Uma2 family endonuclease [Symbiobacteriaceae bacterium]|nr:Uma2 family endonuclease [Symbiobacteriaceae bacterium]